MKQLNQQGTIPHLSVCEDGVYTIKIIKTNRSFNIFQEGTVMIKTAVL